MDMEDELDAVTVEDVCKAVVMVGATGDDAAVDGALNGRVSAAPVCVSDAPEICGGDRGICDGGGGLSDCDGAGVKGKPELNGPELVCPSGECA